MVGLACAAAGLAVLAGLIGLTPPRQGHVLELVGIGLVLVPATRLRVSLRRGDSGAGLSLVEAVLVPLVVSFPTWQVALMCAGVGTVSAALSRAAPIKASFNVASFSLASSAASVVMSAAPTDVPDGLAVYVWVLVALVVTGVLNNLAFVGAIALSQRRPVVAVARETLPGLAPGIGLGWLVNVLIGLLFLMAAQATPFAVGLFPVPLVLLHLAYRGYTVARTDRQRIAGLRDAAVALSTPLDPLDAVEGFLAEVVRSFECRGAWLVLSSGPEAAEVYQADRSGSMRRRQVDDPAGAELALLAYTDVARLTRGDAADLLDRLGWRDAVVAPLDDEQEERSGCLVLIDQSGVDRGSDAAVLQALARETAHTLARGRLLERVTEERRKLDQVMGATSDGIFTLDEDGRVVSWNAACARISGYTAEQVVGRDDVADLLQARNPNGPISTRGWTGADTWSPEVFITRADGTQRRLSCSFRRGRADEAGEPSSRLAVVARDVTPADQYHDLRVQFEQLVEQSAAQRLVVEHLQRAVAPEPPSVEGADVAVTYVASDPSSPTGGDLYDWYLLPDGRLHLAVVDVVGHGVTATKDALTVVHSLRFGAADGTPLGDLVERADALLAAEDLDLAATAVIGSYEPATGRLQIVSGGHPPALVLRSDGSVETVDATGGAIGWPGVGSHAVADLVLGPGDSLVLYTDGLVEGRRDLVDGLHRLTGVAAALSPRPAAEIAHGLVAAGLEGADRRDDTLALVLRRTEVQRRSWTCEAGSSVAVSRVRRDFTTWLREQGATVPRVRIDDAVLVVSELVTNGVAAATSTVSVSGEVSDTGVSVEVHDDGPGAPDLPGQGFEAPAADEEHGRGLYLVRQLSRDVEIEHGSTGTRVRATVRW